MTRFLERSSGRGSGSRSVRSESGQVLVIFALVLPVLIAVVALAVNLGGWFSSDAGVQKSADFGALAGAQYLAAQATSSAGSPAQCSGSADYVSCAKTVAQSSFEGEGMTFCDPATGAPKDPWHPGGKANQVEVGVCHEGFTGVLGTTANVRRYAIAQYTGINGGIGAIPITFQPPSGAWPSPGTTTSFVFDNNSLITGGFDVIDLSALSGPCNGNGTNNLATCISCAQTYSLPNFTPNPPAAGCAGNGQTCSGTAYNNNPGFVVNSSQIDAAFKSLYGKVVLIPIYDPTQSTGNGRNGTYYIIGFAAFEITNWDKKSATLTGTFWGFLLPNQTSCAGTGGNFGVYTIYMIG